MLHGHPGPCKLKYYCMKSLRFFLAAFLLFTYAGVPAQHVMNGDRKQNFDSDWKFLLGDHQNASATGFGDGNWRTLDLPHDWSIEGKIDSTNPSGADGGYFPAGIAWYRKTFRVGQQLQQKRLELLKPISDKVVAAANEVAQEKGLSIVIGKNDVVCGGVDITADVLKKITGK